VALVQLPVVEQRLDAVRAVLAGARVGEVAASLGVSRQSVHAWTVRYLAGGVAGLADRSHRPRSSPRQVADVVEVAVLEMRRQHPRWGAKRIRMELLRRPLEWAVPSTRTINRVLVRHGLVVERKRKRPRDSYVRWQRPAPMQLWQIDIVGRVWLVDPRTGVVREAKIVTGVDDHSRFCVIAAVAERATGRAVCVAYLTDRQVTSARRCVFPIWSSQVAAVGVSVTATWWPSARSGSTRRSPVDALSARSALSGNVHISAVQFPRSRCRHQLKPFCG